MLLSPKDKPPSSPISRKSKEKRKNELEEYKEQDKRDDDDDDEGEEEAKPAGNVVYGNKRKCVCRKGSVLKGKCRKIVKEQEG
ncbi:hypothetical protein GDO81_006480 [Engystomops pustulosus]|uniref:Uncharacterized protein n=1 Tax=Engystomops pustulosus TaxID=76066 RepID=A0AAV7D041_ENGPU|nr:hypothetical protein GDO81_006480 [Engystomops pustulosus]